MDKKSHTIKSGDLKLSIVMPVFNKEPTSLLNFSIVVPCFSEEKTQVLIVLLSLAFMPIILYLVFNYSKGSLCCWAV
jgi:hypothetical protein